jgi:hypothetical protein
MVVRSYTPAADLAASFCASMMLAYLVGLQLSGLHEKRLSHPI